MPLPKMEMTAPATGAPRGCSRPTRRGRRRRPRGPRRAPPGTRTQQRRRRRPTRNGGRNSTRCPPEGCTPRWHFDRIKGSAGLSIPDAPLVRPSSHAPAGGVCYKVRRSSPRAPDAENPRRDGATRPRDAGLPRRPAVRDRAGPPGGRGALQPVPAGADHPLRDARGRPGPLPRRGGHGRPAPPRDPPRQGAGRGAPGARAGGARATSRPSTCGTTCGCCSRRACRARC